ncbi:MAG: hypothetical protein Q9220_002028 [cf. Caloplaca sp. 1 TL-2023]
MDDFENFDSLFAFDPDCAYSEQTISKIIKNRRTANNELFIDRLFKALGLEKSSKPYPPRSNQDLRALHERIIESSSPDHHKQSVLYYILQDIPDKGFHPAPKFVKSVFLPEKYRIFIDGIWYLDRCKFEKALDYLTEPVLTPTFPEEILYLLCTHPDQHDDKLPLAYYYTVSPPITSPKVLEALFSTIAKSSVTEAFFWVRKQIESSQRNLFEQLISASMEGPEGEDRARRSVELVHLPFNKAEETWFDKFLRDGRGRTFAGAKDALEVRAIATGRGHTGRDREEIDPMKVSAVGSSFDHGLMTPPR